MSKRKLDNYNRWRSKTVSFRMSPEENELLNSYVRMSGLEKQEYLIQRALNKPVVIKTTPRVCVALKRELEELAKELLQTETSDKDLFDRIEFLKNIIKEINNKGEQNYE